MCQMTKLPATVLVVCLLALVAGHASAEVLQVHIIAHSHCDPGWLETFEGYGFALLCSMPAVDPHTTFADITIAK